jgi:flavin-dependent dehydrogenase
MDFDVAIIGGGPSASLCGSFLKKYKPEVRVGIFEREVFPRDHIGESQLPIIGKILDEIGVWDKVEAAGFPIKIGGTYRWGNSDDLWNFDFLPGQDFQNQPRPAKYCGQRHETAFQVDRAVYDEILLDHAEELGCEVFQGCGVREVRHENDRVTELSLANGDSASARHYVDASGHVGLLRRAMSVAIEEPSTLRNIAVWDYWQDAQWAVTLGTGGTRIQVMSIGYGWLWFIPITETRTSLGLVCPADYYKKSGYSPEELYLKAIDDEPRIRHLVRNARREGNFGSTKDWSFVAERMTGENWMLIGEALGFADPILSAGLSLASVSAKQAAFTMLELDRGGDTEWLKQQYEAVNRRKVLQHIRFADYWYSANTHFSDLKEYTREIARDVGLDLSADKAFQWLGTGGFIEEDMEAPGLATLGLSALHQVTQRLSQAPPATAIKGFNGFEANLEGAEKIFLARYDRGRVHKTPALLRNRKQLPLGGQFGMILDLLKVSRRADVLITNIARSFAARGMQYEKGTHWLVLQSLDALARDEWIRPVMLPEGAPITVDFSLPSNYFATNTDALPV